MRTAVALLNTAKDAIRRVEHPDPTSVNGLRRHLYLTSAGRRIAMFWNVARGPVTLSRCYLD